MLRILALLALTSFTAISVKADPVFVLGNVSLNNLLPLTVVISVHGPGADVQAIARMTAGFLRPCDVCFPGATVNMGSRFLATWSDFDTGSVTINGNNYGIVPNLNPPPGSAYAQSEMIFTAENFIIPTGGGTLVITVPFTMTGNFTAFGAQVASAQLTGGGLATLRGTWNTNGSYYQFNQVSYQFLPAPEPATIILLCSGLVGVGLRLRKRY